MTNALELTMLFNCHAPPNANRQPPGPPTPSTGPDPPRSVYGMLGSAATSRA
ncbi:MAG: hypothetical protein WBR35_03130 [Anaerolineae bacterium]